MIDLYIYYQVAEPNAARMETLVRAMQARLGALHGVSAQLKRRPEAPAGLQTWMEIYAGTEQGFEAHLAAAAHQGGLAPLIQGERHTEVFMDIQACA